MSDLAQSNVFNNVTVIDVATDTVTATIPLSSPPLGLAMTPRTQKLYVAHDPYDMTVIDTAYNSVTYTVIGSPIAVGDRPRGVAVTRDSAKVYVANELSNSVSVIATATNTVIATIPVSTLPIGVAVALDGSKVFVGTMVPVRGSAQSGAPPVSGTTR